MKSTIKLCLVSLIFVTLAGCSTNTASLTKYQPGTVYNKERAIIVVRVQNSDFLDLQNPRGAEYRVNGTEPSILSPSDYANSVYTIEPGQYYISYAFKFVTNGSLDFTRKPGISPKGIVQYGAFEVKAGEIAYLGDISLDWVTNNPDKRVLIEHNLVEVKQELAQAGMMDLSTKIVTAKYIPNGSSFKD